MFNTTKTIYATILEVANLLNKKYEVLPNTTLNEKFNLNIVNTEDRNPYLRYYCFGLDYESSIQDTSINIDNIRHKPTDGSLFKHIPFIARKADQDLTNQEKEKYRLRIKRYINEEEYIFYFLKIIDGIDINDKLLYVTNDTNDTFLSLFSTEVDHILNPVIEERDRVDDALIDYIAYIQHIKISIPDEELNELYKATTLYYNITEDEITLGELGLVSGNEVITEEGYFEATNTQINYFQKINHMFKDINIQNEFSEIIEIGGMSPMVFRTYNP